MTVWKLSCSRGERIERGRRGDKKTEDKRPGRGRCGSYQKGVALPKSGERRLPEEEVTTWDPPGTSPSEAPLESRVQDHTPWLPSRDQEAATASAKPASQHSGSYRMAPGRLQQKNGPFPARFPGAKAAQKGIHCCFQIPPSTPTSHLHQGETNLHPDPYCQRVLRNVAFSSLTSPEKGGLEVESDTPQSPLLISRHSSPVSLCPRLWHQKHPFSSQASKECPPVC